MEEKLEKVETTLESCNRRLEELTQIFNARKAQETREDATKSSLRMWCILVREKVIIPSTEEQAKLSHPRGDGNLSYPMECAVKEATILGIRNLPDISLVINAFGCLSWALRALFVLRSKPKVEEIRSLVAQSEGVSFKLPETKCVRMLQSPLSRATLWQAKVAKALKAIPGERKSYDIEMLTKLHIGVREIPYLMSEEYQICNTIEDEGNRHCICGGPSDGRFMISCDKCELWFHGDCVKFDKIIGDEQPKWICPPCSTETPPKTIDAFDGKTESSLDRKANVEKKVTAIENKDTEHVSEEDFSPHAPNPDDIWPPYGLLQSAEALSALGISKPSECDSLSNVFPDAAPTQQVMQLHALQVVEPTRSLVPIQQPLQQPMPQISQIGCETEKSFLAQCHTSSLSVVSPVFPGGECINRVNEFVDLSVTSHHMRPHHFSSNITSNISRNLPTQQNIPLNVPIRIHINGGAQHPDGFYPNSHILNDTIPTNNEGSEVPTTMMAKLPLSVEKR